MKTARQVAILELIAARAINTQDELVQALTERGFQVTQATVSRDIKALRLTKAPTTDGGYRYAAPTEPQPAAEDDGLTGRFIRILRDSVLSVEGSGNLMVIKTLSGSASAVAEALDSMDWPEVLGTLAGDNTILMVIREDASRNEVRARIERLIR